MTAPSPDRHARALEEAVARGGAARSALVASWSRSFRLHALDPAGGGSPPRVTEAELAQARERAGALMRTAAPILDGLFLTVGSSGCCVLLADAEGLPLERRGAPGDDPDFSGWGLWPGALWSEAAQGTNGIGTAVVEERGVTIHRDQHFLARNGRLSCMSAPIFGAEGRLEGVLDLSSARADLSEPMAHLLARVVADAARRIEGEGFRRAFPGARILLAPGEDAHPGALLAVDADDLVVGATRAARSALGLTGDLVRDPVPASDLFGQADTVRTAERAVYARALARAGGNVSEAARRLGVSRATFHRRIGRRPHLSQS